MNLVFTLCSNNYLAQAITLGDTLFQFNPDYKFIIGLVDRKNEIFDYSKIQYELLEVEKIGIANFNEMILRYDIVELNTSVKPFYFKYFFTTEKPETIIYLDPDIQIFAPLSDLEKELTNHDIVITPHFFTPLNDDKWQAEEDFLNAGIYNLGFIALKNTINSLKMLEWWAERLRTKAFIDYRRGLFTDQIWITFVPLFFENVKVLKHLGYNVAYWNLHERLISNRNGVYFINDNIPLVFYHYASYRPLNPSIISSGQKRFTFESRPEITPLFNNYCELIFKNEYENLANIKCHFVEIRGNHVKKKLNDIKQKTPIYKRAMSKIVNKVIRKFGLVLDYTKLLTND